MIRDLIFVGLGGGIGSMARYLCSRWMLVAFPGAFPAGTLLVNITGCFLIGLFWTTFTRSYEGSENWRLFLMTGLCGGYTTFSAFTLESINLVREQKTGLFFLYIGTSIISGLLATWAGIRLIRA